MNSGKACFLAIGLFIGGSLSHSVKAQEQNPQNQSGNSVAQNSQEQNASTHNAKDGVKSNGSASQNSQGKQNANKSNNQQGKGAPQAFWLSDKDQQNLSYTVAIPQLAK